jgi:hypothetical protein
MRRGLLNTTFICGLATATLLAAAPARAADDDVPLDKKIMRGILEGLGLQRDGNGINYQERAPLVVPSNRTLPEPEKAGVALNNPAWPKDPDVERAKEAKRREQTGKLTSDVREEEQNPLRPDQLTPGRRPGERLHTARKDDDYQASPYGYGGALKPSELGYSGGMFGNLFGNRDNDAVRFTGEKPRASLTDPPAGYQTPSPLQPYGIGAAAPKATDYYGTRGELTR